MSEQAAGPRARFRAQTRAEIKLAALGQLADGGPSGIALIRIAKGLGMTGPAIYRYFDNRDALLSELIGDAYHDMATAIQTAATSAPGDPRTRLHALSAAYLSWATAQPHRYLLIQGTPVPGYTAPPDTVDSARAVLAPFLHPFGHATPTPSLNALIDQMRSWLRADPLLAAWVRHHNPNPATPASALTGAVLAWSLIHGTVSLDAAHHFTGMGHTTTVLLTTEIDMLADSFGLPATP
jgi:AcrR family transcriptional regulator